MNNAMSLKAKIRNIAKQKGLPAQVILQNYMFERLLVRLAASAYKDKFVLKGGMLVAAIVGLDNRATMDLDATLKNLPLTPEAIRSALEQVAAVSFDDGVTFEVGKISPIREDDIYGGYRVMLSAHFDTLITPLSIDVSTGDAITPHAIPDREIFMMRIFWQPRRNLTRQCLPKRCAPPPITGAPPGRLRMCPPFCPTSRAAGNLKPCGKSTANSLLMPPPLSTARSWMC